MLIGVNNSSLGGLKSNLECTNNNISIQTSWHTEFKYTATEDCVYYLYVSVDSYNLVGARIELNNKNIGGFNTTFPDTAYGTVRATSVILPLKANDKLELFLATTDIVKTENVFMIKGKLQS